MFYTRCYVALIIMEQYPTLEKLYYKPENKIGGTVKVLSVAKHYGDNEEYVVYQNTHTGTIGTIKLVQWNESINMDKREGCIDERPRFYHH
jgi:hypothetical protein